MEKHKNLNVHVIKLSGEGKKKANPKSHLLCDFIYITFLNDNILELENRLVVFKI